MLTARAIDATDHAAIDELRIASYRRATWFTLEDADRVRCARDAPRSRITAVFDGCTPVSTICQTVVRDVAEVERVLELRPRLHHTDFPALAVTRAATAEGYTGLRLNHVLRWYTLHAAQRAGIRSIVAGHAGGTPNLRVMLELGYRFRAAEHSSMSQVRINTEHVMTYLPAADFATALQRLAPIIAGILPRIVWQREPLSFAELLQPAAQTR